MALVLILGSLAAAFLCGCLVAGSLLRFGGVMRPTAHHATWRRLSGERVPSVEETIRRDYAEDAINSLEFELRITQLIEKVAEQSGEAFDSFAPLILDGGWEFDQEGRLKQSEQAVVRSESKRRRPRREHQRSGCTTTAMSRTGFHGDRSTWIRW